MKPVDVKSSKYIDFNKENKKENPKFKVCVVIKIFSQKVMFPIGQKKCL